MRYAGFGLMVLATCAGAQMQSATSLPFPRFALHDGKVDADGLPLSGAALCVGRGNVACFVMPDHRYGEQAESLYRFGIEAKAERLALSGGGSWVFFSALFSAGGSGTLERLAVLRYEVHEGKARISNLLPYADASNISGRAMWTMPEISAYPVLVHGDFIWAEGETHFDPHRYSIEAWVYDPRMDRYAKRMTYATERKYCSDCEHPEPVLRTERAEIMRRLTAPR